MRCIPTWRILHSAAILTLLAATGSRAQTIGVNVGFAAPLAAGPGTGVALPISVDMSNAGATGIASFASRLNWNPQHMRFDSLRASAPLAASGWTLTANPSAAPHGIVSFVMAGPSALTANTTILTAHFTALTLQGGTRVQLWPSAAEDGLRQSVIASLRLGSQDVCVASPTARWGDVTADQRVDILDAQQLARYSVGLLVMQPVATAMQGDVSADGLVSIIDAQQVARFSVGLSASSRVGSAGPSAPTPTAVSITPTTTTLVETTSTQLSAVLLGTNTELSGCSVLTWTSSNPAIVSVNASGYVTALQPGAATITASSSGRTSDLALNVIARPVADWSGVTPWTTFQGNPAHTSYVPVVADPAAFTHRWTGTIGVGAGTAAVEGNGRAFAVASGFNGPGTVTAFDATSGVVAWSTPMGANARNMPAAYGAGAVILHASDHGPASYIRAHEEATGAIRFSTAFWSQSGTHQAPVVVGTSIVHGCDSYSGICSHSAVDGTRSWFVQAYQSEGWTPAVSNGVVYTYTAAGSKKVSAIDLLTGALLYEIHDFTVGWQTSFSSPVIDNNRLFVTESGRLIAFDLTTRARAWEVAGSFTGSVAAANGVLYVAHGTRIEARSQADGAFLWSWTAPAGNVSGSLVVTRNLLFVATSVFPTIQNSYAIDLLTHGTVWSYPAGLQLSIGTSGNLYVSQGSGELSAIRLR